MCNIVLSFSLHDTYNNMKSGQNRGFEGAGIAGYGDHGIDAIKWSGPVRAFSLDTLYEIFPADKYFMYGGHTRYATRGRKDKILQDSHPHVIGGWEYSVNGSHTIIRDAEQCILHNGQVEDKMLSRIDKSLLKSDCDSEAFLHLYREVGEKELMRQVPGTYSAIIFDKYRGGAIVMRDRHGTKPAWLAVKDGKHIIASETHPLQENGATIRREVSPGEIIYVNRDGTIRNELVVKPDMKFCFFEKNYIQNPESEGVRQARYDLGLVLAEEFNPGDIDIVTYVPRCPEFVAEGYAHGVGKKMKKIFYKITDDRSFMQSTQAEREGSIWSNLFLLDNVISDLYGKVVAVADDSQIRGTVLKRVAYLLKEVARVKKFYYILATPPIGVVRNGIEHGCEYGVDIPPRPIDPKDNFAVRRFGDGSGSAENIRLIEEASNTDKIYYISTDGMFRALKIKKENSCYFCIGGPRLF